MEAIVTTSPIGWKRIPVGDKLGATGWMANESEIRRLGGWEQA